jgi:hypothetical protein
MVPKSVLLNIVTLRPSCLLLICGFVIKRADSVDQADIFLADS